MKRLLTAFLISMLALPVSAAQNLPADIQKFIERRDGCDHMRGELSGEEDKKRLKELTREMRRLCKGTDKELARLRKKYGTNTLIRHRLDEFDPGIESAVMAQRGKGRAKPSRAP